MCIFKWPIFLLQSKKCKYSRIALNACSKIKSTLIQTTRKHFVKKIKEKTETRSVRIICVDRRFHNVERIKTISFLMLVLTKVFSEMLNNKNSCL